MTDINKETVLRVAHLARMGISDEEAEQYTAELGKILAFVDELQEVDTENIEGVGHITGMENAVREDAKPEKLPAEDHDLLEEQAPGHVGEGEIRVPRIID